MWLPISTMDSPLLYDTPNNTHPPPPSATASDPASSPSLSFYSRGPSARSSSSTSSPTSSPITRNSIEIFGSTKTALENVREEPHERDEDFNVLDANTRDFFARPEQPARSSLDYSHRYSASHADYYFDDRDISPVSLSARSSVKKQRSGDSPLSGVSHRFGARFPSFSRKWKTKTGSSPKLSIVTQAEMVSSRSGSAASSQLVSPALSAISKHESHLIPSPARTTFDDNISESGLGPINIEKPSHESEEDELQATTPLLPPILKEMMSAKNTEIQSPLQSPTIAAAFPFPTSTSPGGTPHLSTVPSPPGSTSPSVASYHQHQHSRTGTIIACCDIPSMTMLDDQSDEWSQRLGHANFNIHPEPYAPETIHLDSYHQLRANWEHARANYTKHLTRTGEHYGTTSKIYMLTEQKWAAVDSEWKKHDATMTKVLGPIILRISGGDPEMADSKLSIEVLEKPPTKVMVPQIDETCGKFPQLGDEDIVGPMAVAPMRAKSMQAAIMETTAHSRLTKKHNFLKRVSDILGRSSAGLKR